MTSRADGWAIRAFAPADRTAVVGLWRACGLVVPHNDPDADIAFAVGKPNSDILIGVAPEMAVAATVMAGHDGHRGWLYYVAVDPACRGRGYGGAIVAAGEAWLRARGIRKAQLMIRDTNADVREFYAGLGWQAIPRTVMERWL